MKRGSSIQCVAWMAGVARQHAVPRGLVGLWTFLLLFFAVFGLDQPLLAEEVVDTFTLQLTHGDTEVSLPTQQYRTQDNGISLSTARQVNEDWSVSGQLLLEESATRYSSGSSDQLQQLAGAGGSLSRRISTSQTATLSALYKRSWIEINSSSGTPSRVESDAWNLAVGITQAVRINARESLSFGTSLSYAGSSREGYVDSGTVVAEENLNQAYLGLSTGYRTVVENHYQSIQLSWIGSNRSLLSEGSDKDYFQLQLGNLVPLNKGEFMGLYYSKKLDGDGLSSDAVTLSYTTRY